MLCISKLISLHIIFHSHLIFTDHDAFSPQVMNEDELNFGKGARKNQAANLIEHQNDVETTLNRQNNNNNFFNKNLNLKNYSVLNIVNSENHKINEHDMLQANRSDLNSKNTENYQNNYKQVVQFNTLQERYQKLQSLSLQQILSRGKVKVYFYV